MQSTRCPKKPMKRHITCPKVRFGKKVMFSGPYGSLEVIKRSFGGHLMTQKLNSDEHNRISIPKNLEKDILHAPR